jgi:hypothetical protein
MMHTPTFGINQNSGIYDSWLLEYVSDGRILHIDTEQSGSIVFYDRTNSEISTENTDDELLFVPEDAYRLNIETSGDYKFIIFEPQELEILVVQPEIITIGDVIDISISVSNTIDFNDKMTQDRLLQMWEISAPSLEFDISEGQNSIQLIEQVLTDDSTLNNIDHRLQSNYSVDSNQLSIGVNQISFELNSNWHGEFEFNLQLTVFDKVNTIPEITGPTYLEFNQSNGSAFWTYEISDIDEEVLTISLGEEVNGLEIGPTTIDSSGTLEVNWILSDLEDEDYTVTIVVEDQESRVEYTTTLKLIFEEIVSEDVLGCSDLTALNYNELVTVDDGSCVYDDITNNNETDIDDDNNQTELSESDNGETNEQLKITSDDGYTTIYLIVGIVVILLSTMFVFLSRNAKQNHDEFSDLFDLDTGFESPSNHTQFQSSTNNVNQNDEFIASISTPLVHQNTVPNKVDSYMGLKAGGEYSTDQRGVIYTESSGDEWVQLGDGSFVRIN